MSRGRTIGGGARAVAGGLRAIPRRAVAGVRGALLKQVAGRVDLSRIDKIPPALGWPLERDGTTPPARLDALREEAPLSRLTTFLGINVWLVTGYDAGHEVLTDRTSYSTDIRPYVGRSGAADGDIGGLGFTDPPDHTRLRKFLTPEFTRRRLQRLDPLVDRIIARQLDEIEAAATAAPDGVVDLVPLFSFPVPFLVICELLGLPDERREVFRELGSARFDVSGGGIGALGAISGSREFLLAETARQRHDPGPGLIGQIVRDFGDEISDYDLGGLADGAFTGGMETSAGMLALGTVTLLEHPETWQQLVEGTADVDAVVEELLRYLSVVQVAFPRFALTDVEVAGQQVRKGDVVLVHLPAVDRDEAAVGACPHAFDPGRESRSHLAFGHGIHRCVGAELGRVELRKAYPALAARFPAMTLVEGSEDLDYFGSSIVYGVERLLVRPLG
ncbi:cytochrome P450 [Nocardioides zeae]|uniref:Cytochrome P450 n=1 Tax=Nocardioides imazamoxiresistens TaxID=3231893 RepID=A0ABU3PS43_9ACTN|nr:cytochrome P450 [Nocardioides zeae]MDT9591711.1 cytochrome P450 [Nocardioides zeae]